jgi:hypothetical protein
MSYLILALAVYAATRAGRRAVDYMPPGRAKKAMAVIFGGGGPGEER